MSFEKARLLAELAAIGGPIELQLKALGAERRVPVLALGACLMRPDEAAPAILDLIARAATGGRLDHNEETLLFRGLHILAAARHEKAFRPLLGLLRRPDDELDPLLGDVITESLPRIVASVFDGDAEPLFAAIADRTIDEYVRDALMGAATFLAWDGRIDVAAMAAFLKRFFDERLARNEEHVWCGWARAVTLLGRRELEGELAAAFREGRVDEAFGEYEDFAPDLAEAERAPRDVGRLHRAHLGYIDDAREALMLWQSDDDDDNDDYWSGSTPALMTPTANPLRHVGRNDPCPCGSGKKAKKCCLAS